MLEPSSSTFPSAKASGRSRPIARNNRRGSSRLRSIALLLMGAAGITALLGYREATTPLTQREGERVRAVLVERGATFQELARTLERDGLIRDATSFYWLARWTGAAGILRTGEYLVRSSDSPWIILRILKSGVSITHPLLVREGQNLYEVAESLEGVHPGWRDEFLAAANDNGLLTEFRLPQGVTPRLLLAEGYFFPETYKVTRVMNPREILRMGTRLFNQRWKPEFDARSRELGLTRHEVVTLASMIEKETGAPEERPVISSVFHNRLKKKMRLQSDPTTIYGIWERYTGNLHKSDLLESTPWNTYTQPGLPAGPIGNPGLAAIEAALYPAQSDYLYFVSRNDGTHQFTRTYEEHLAAVKSFQLNSAARKGKSWRDRLKSD